MSRNSWRSQPVRLRADATVGAAVTVRTAPKLPARLPAAAVASSPNATAADTAPSVAAEYATGTARRGVPSAPVRSGAHPRGGHTDHRVLSRPVFRLWRILRPHRSRRWIQLDGRRPRRLDGHLLRAIRQPADRVPPHRHAAEPAHHPRHWHVPGWRLGDCQLLLLLPNVAVAATTKPAAASATHTADESAAAAAAAVHAPAANRGWWLLPGVGGDAAVVPRPDWHRLRRGARHQHVGPVVGQRRHVCHHRPRALHSGLRSSGGRVRVGSVPRARRQEGANKRPTGCHLCGGQQAAGVRVRRHGCGRRAALL